MNWVSVKFNWGEISFRRPEYHSAVNQLASFISLIWDSWFSLIPGWSLTIFSRWIDLRLGSPRSIIRAQMSWWLKAIYMFSKFEAYVFWLARIDRQTNFKPFLDAVKPILSVKGTSSSMSKHWWATFLSSTAVVRPRSESVNDSKLRVGYT